MKPIEYVASKTGAKFHAAPHFVRGIMGPIGSGKSVTCCMEIISRAMQQAPSPDGIRRSRWGIIRNTYPELKSTTIKTWADWIKPEHYGSIKFDSPISQKATIATGVELEILFLALDRPDDIKKLLSLELSGVWINEAREIPKAVLDAASGRVGRYPNKREGGCSHPCVILDTNPPDDDHWWYTLFEELAPEDYILFKQPSGRSRDAENIENLPDGYYDRLLSGKTPEWIKVYVDGEYGTIIDGRPVYPEFNDTIHVAKEPLKVFRGLPLTLGWDFGLTPTCIFTQLTSRGQFRVIDELVSESMGIRQFISRFVKPHIANHYQGIKLESWGDPAGVRRSDTDERTCFDELNSSGILTEPARTNDPTARREAVAGFLTGLVDGEPSFLLSPNCKILRRGFNGGYHYRRMRVPGAERFTDKPDKNSYSHPHDGLQYAALASETPVFNRNDTAIPHYRPVQHKPRGGY